MDSIPLWRLYAAPPTVRVFVFLFLFLACQLKFKFPQPAMAPNCRLSKAWLPLPISTTRALAGETVGLPPSLHSPPLQPSLPSTLTTTTRVCTTILATGSKKTGRCMYNRNQLLKIDTPACQSCLEPEVIATLKDLGIGYKLPRGKRSARGGKRKRKRIPVITGHGKTRVCDPRNKTEENLIFVPVLSICTPPSDQLCVCLFNAHSVGPASTRNQITDFILDNNIDIMLLTETWLRSSGDEAKCCDLTPTGYHLHSIPRPPHSSGQFARGGGLAFLLKDCLSPFSTVKTVFPFNHSSFEVAQLSLNLQHTFINLVCVYRPPPCKRNMLKDSTFLDELPHLLEYSSNLFGKVIIAGDFNVHYENVSDSKTMKIRDIISMFNFVQSVTEPTHVHGHILDLVLYPCFDSFVSSTNVCHDLTSDHMSVLCKLSIPKPAHHRTTKTIRSIHKIDKTKLKGDLESVIVSDMSLPDFNSNLQNLLDKHAPLHQVSIRTERATPWYNTVAPQLTELKRERRKAERCWRSSGLTIHKQIYNSIKRTIADLVQKTKTQFFSSKISASKTCKELYRNMNQILGKTQAAVFPSNIESEKLPDTFLNFFRDKIVAIRNAFPSPHPLDEIPIYSGPRLSAFKPVSQQFVKEILQKSAKKSCELDPFPTTLLFENIDTLLPTITNIFNDSLSNGTVPADFKTAIVKPLLKKSSLNPDELKKLPTNLKSSFLVQNPGESSSPSVVPTPCFKQSSQSPSISIPCWPQY